MYALLLQDWVTIRSASGGVITQGEAAWLDTSAFLDVVVFLETKNFAISAGSLMMALQTSPTKDDVFFQSMNDVSNTTGTPVAVGVQTFVMLRDTALCPLAHWLRWQLGPPPTNPSGASSFEATFRLWASANQPGGFARSSSMGSQMGYGESGGSGGPAWTTVDSGGNPVPYQPPPPSKTWARQLHVQLGPSQRGSSTFAPGPKPWSPLNAPHQKLVRPAPPPRHVIHTFDLPNHGNLVAYVPPEAKVTNRKGPA